MLPLLPPLPARAPGAGARSAPLMTASEALRLMAGSTPTTSNPVIAQNPETMGACSDQARLLGGCRAFSVATSTRLLPGTNTGLWSWSTINTTQLQVLAFSAPATSNPGDKHTHRGPWTPLDLYGGETVNVDRAPGAHQSSTASLPRRQHTKPSLTRPYQWCTLMNKVPYQSFACA